MPIYVILLRKPPAVLSASPPRGGEDLPPTAFGEGDWMYACPTCGSTNLRYTYVAEGEKESWIWECTYCKGWSGKNPIRRQDPRSVAPATGQRYKKEDITPAMRSLQESGDLILIDLGDEVEAIPVTSDTGVRLEK